MCRTHHAIRLATAVTLLVCLARPAEGEPSWAREELPPLFVEVAGGAGVPSSDAYGAVGLALRAAVGVGAAIEGLPLALYVTVSFTWSHFADTRRSRLHTAELVQDAYVYAIGVRGVVGVSERLQLVLDAAGGYRSVGAAADIDGIESYSLTEGHALPIVGAGLRYRFLDWLQAGLLWECQFLQPLDGPDVPAAAAGRASPRGERWQMNVLVGASAEF